MTPRARWLFLVCTLAGLSAVIAWEPGFDADLAPWARLPSVLPETVQRPGALAGPDEADRASSIAVIDARPLFEPGRRLLVKVTPVTRTHGERAISKPQVSGIIITATDRFALLAGGPAAGDSAARKLHAGDQVGPWTVQAIDLAGVTFDGPGGQAIVRPAFSTAPLPSALPLPPPSSRQSGYSPGLFPPPDTERPAASGSD